MADQHAVHIGQDEMLKLFHDVGGTIDAQRQAEAVRAVKRPSRIIPKLSPKQFYGSCGGIMY